MLQSYPPVASGTVEGLDLLLAHHRQGIVLKVPDEDLESRESCELGDQPFGTLEIRGTDADSPGSDDHLEVVDRFENAATPGTLGLCQTVDLFELHCETDESLLSFGLEQPGIVGGPGGLSCRTVGCLGGWRVHCGGSCLVANLGHLERSKGGFQLS